MWTNRINAWRLSERGASEQKQRPNFYHVPRGYPMNDLDTVDRKYYDKKKREREKERRQRGESRSQSSISPVLAKLSSPRDWNGRTSLLRACKNDDLEKAKQCFKQRPEDLNVPDDAGNTPLQRAAQEGFVNIVQFLLQAGAEVDTQNRDKDTPLIDAVEAAHVEVVRLLLEFGANPRLANADGDIPYDLVPEDNLNCEEIGLLIAKAKGRDFRKRRNLSNFTKGEEHLTRISEDPGQGPV